MKIDPIALIVGLGNPGPEYDGTRHNAGADFVKSFADSHFLTFKKDNKFQGYYTRLQQDGLDCHLLIPTTYMNCSGQAVRAVANFYKIPPEHILVAHDDLDLPPGTVRIRQSGGHGGHNGVRDIMSHLNTKDFYRVRIGIDHPGNRADVTNYVLKKAPNKEQILIAKAMDDALRVTPQLLEGDIQDAIQSLHTEQQRERTTNGI